MRGVALWRHWRTLVAPVFLGALATGCVSFSDGPARLYTVPEETQLIRDNIQQINLVQFSTLDEASRMRVRNDWIGARMYAIDIQYTPYEAALTKERQGVGFGAATTTIALTTASGLVAPVATKNVLTGLAGLVTGARAAYDSDILLSHSVQWIQSQMEAKRAEISSRILRGMKFSTIDYPLAAALSDLEAYYRAGTFTGGLLSTNEIIAADAKNAAEDKAAAQGLGEFGGPVVVAPPKARDKVGPVAVVEPKSDPEHEEVIAKFNPKVHSIGFVQNILKRLCAPPSEVIRVTTKTNARIKAFQQNLRDTGSTTVAVTGKLSPTELGIVGAKPVCPTKLFENIYEEESFPLGINDAGLVELMNAKLPANRKLTPAAATVADIRLRIADLRVIFAANLKLNDKDLSDQLTLELFRAIAK